METYFRNITLVRVICGTSRDDTVEHPQKGKKKSKAISGKYRRNTIIGRRLEMEMNSILLVRQQIKDIDIDIVTKPGDHFKAKDRLKR